MDELPEPTPEAIKKAKRFYWIAYGLSAFVLMAIWTVVLGLSTVWGKYGLLAPYFGSQYEYLRRANPVGAIMPLAGIIATIVCRRSKVTLEMRSRELIHMHRSDSSTRESAAPLTVQNEKSLAYVGMGLGVFFALVIGLVHFLGRDKPFGFLEVSGILSALVAIWSFVAWRWGKWNIATIDHTGVTLRKSSPWRLQKSVPKHIAWENLEAVEVGRTRNALGAESVGWISLFDKSSAKWHQVHQEAVSEANWKTFRERMRAEARREDPTRISVARTATVCPAISSEPEVRQIRQW